MILASVVALRIDVFYDSLSETSANVVELYFIIMISASVVASRIDAFSVIA